MENQWLKWAILDSKSGSYNCNETLSQVSKIQLTTREHCHLPSWGIHKSKKQIKYMYLLKETKASNSTACRHCLSFNSPRPFVGLLKCVVLLDTINFYKQCCVTVFTVYSTFMLKNIAVICFRELLEPCFIPNKCTMQWWATSFVMYMYMYLKS